MRLVDISLRLGDKVLFDSISYDFPQGKKIALVGENGAGKSTLLNVITQTQDKDAGQIVVPAFSRVGFLPQEPNPNPKSSVLLEAMSGDKDLEVLSQKMAGALAVMEKSHTEESITAYSHAEAEFASGGGYQLESRAAEILDGLGFAEQAQQKDPRSLSGGWRMRVELAKVLLYRPTMLILDEPTNHLDLPSLQWVEGYLKQFPGTLLFVSHDRHLLNRLSEITLHLHRGKLKSYVGNYDAFLTGKQLQEEQLVAQKQGLERKRAHLQKFVDRFGAKASKATQAQSRAKMIDRLKEEEGQLDVVRKASTMKLKLAPPLPNDRIVLQIENGAIGYQDPLATGVNLQIERGHKIGIIGANGIGKSTLLKTIMAHIPALGGKFMTSARTKPVYFAQDQLDIFEGDKSVLENIAARTSLGEPEVRSLLGSLLFGGDEINKPIRVLSGGEKSRVGLCNVLAQEQNFLLLDEPTNHLDMQSIDSLGQALQSYQGTLLFVSHDRDFIDQVATHIFVMLPDGRSRLFEGKLDDYRRLAKLSGFVDILESVEKEVTKASETHPDFAKADKVDAKQSHQRRKRLQKLEKECQKLEKKLTQLQAALVGVQKKFETADYNNFDYWQSLEREQTELQRSIESTESRWMEAPAKFDVA
ncbi:MAG: ABC-F family ATP-binding cassette domain-containing protein, partial [Zetaproteobacteria bacterium]|nr:ABC-F family ATP-binding cassette domain-containing protein [Zetaproteobacteria bacterium]